MHARPSRPGPTPGRSAASAQQARRLAPARQIVARPTSNGGRLGAAILSAIVPGLGQLANRQVRLAAIFALPAAVLVALVWILLQLNSPARLVATLIVPATLGVVLVLNGLLLLWRLASVGQAFLDRRHLGRASARGWLGLALVMAFVAVPHGFGNWVGLAALGSFERIFQPPTDGAAAPPPGPGTTERLNVLLIGIDRAPGRTAALTDSLIVASLDPVGETVTMVSVPRDTINVPLGNGNVFGPKINSLYGYANRHPDEFPGGGTEALETAIGTLLDIDIHYHAEIDLTGFVSMVDAVGGVDVNVRRPLSDPEYGGFGIGPGWSIEPGQHHLAGPEALAYVRIRKSPGESDFTRAERQQQILVAVRDAAVKGESLLFRLPGLLDAVGGTVRTNLPPDRLPLLAALAEEIDGDRTVRIVIRHPLVSPASNQYGAVQIPDVPAIQAVAARAFTDPGVEPQPWPTPKPTSAPPSPKP